MLSQLLSHAENDPQTLKLSQGGGRAFVSSSLRPFLLAALVSQSPARPAIVVTGDDRQARDLAVSLRAWLAPRTVRYYPSRGVTYESHLSPTPHLTGRRVAALDALQQGDQGRGAPVILASATALSEKVPDPSLRPRGFTLTLGEQFELEDGVEKLVEAGYERVDQVQDRGQFAVRGGILDLFPATEERAVRVELFGDEIDRLSWFSTFTQRSLGNAESIEVAPAAELAAEYRELAEIAALEDDENRPDIAELLPVEDFKAFLDLAGDEVQLLIAAEEEIVPALADNWQDICAAFPNEEAHQLYIAPEQIEAALRERARILLSSIEQDQQFEFRAQSAEIAASGVRQAEPELEKLTRSGYRTVVTFSSRGEGERLAYNLGRMDVTWLETKPAAAGPAGPAAALNGSLVFAQARLGEGFIAPAMNLAVIPEQRLFRHRRTASEAAAASTRRGRLRSFAELRTGDIVVHEDHGIARFAGFDTKTVAGITRDYLYLEYAGQDRVYAPVDQLAKISRYVGAGGARAGGVQLSKLGGTRWDAMKSRARRAAQDMAGELLNLYAERKHRAGHAFAPDSDWQREFEDAFPYNETPDQLETIELVKADMEAPRPMDRLVCGDVGYGKTEVALRAAFKAVQDNKQVMFLVPTTILTQQHYGTFSERLKDYPVRVEQVSRFRSAAEQKQVIADFAAGKVDILIGTHRLLSRDVRAKDLGLLIVDEEQRFGVRQKELLRQMKLKVDVIAMTATPIPRTLQMSLAGIRDISVIETAPQGRRPIKTYVGEYDEQLVKAALLREHARGGQAFFLHNRVESIEETAERLRGLCPDLRFLVAHGQMDDGELERKMMAFLRGDADVLVSTTIIESGIDIPQANTLIVENADTFGLSQLYQIRGRVGRSRERAYAYLLYPSAAALSGEAAQRLAALSDFTELGAGLKIAMRDLEIRGAGNLLGEEQSGQVAALGFELYMQMLDEAVAAMSGGTDGNGNAVEDDGLPADWEPVRLDIDIDAYVPAAYIPYEQAKVDVHRRIAAAREVADLVLLREELSDRFGEIPEPLENLITLQIARVKLGQAGATTVSFRGGRLAVTPIELGSRQAKELRARIPESLYESGRSQFSMRLGGKSASHQLGAVVRAADALLAVIREAAEADAEAGDGSAAATAVSVS
jgi:transcription-repair coupling factor (superfamily II helicase)